MSKLILQMQTSADGFVQPIEPSTSFTLWDWGPVWPWDDKLRGDFNATFAGAGSIVLSSAMAQEGYLDYWRSVWQATDGDPSYAFAARIVELPKVVVTSRPGLSFPGAEVAVGPLIEQVAEVKRRSSGDVLAFGGVRFAHSLISAGAVDEFHLFANPTAVGGGASAFPPGPTLPLTLLESTPYACGIVVTKYKRFHPAVLAADRQPA